jgi:hypothetical protein
MVKISTGPLSSGAPDGIVPVETAIALLKDMGGSSIKYFPMGGLKHRDEYQCGGSLRPSRFLAGADRRYRSGKLQRDCRSRWTRVSKIIPHIYSSIIDKASGNTRPADVRQLLEMTKQWVK